MRGHMAAIFHVWHELTVRVSQPSQGVYFSRPRHDDAEANGNQVQAVPHGGSLDLGVEGESCRFMSAHGDIPRLDLPGGAYRVGQQFC